MSSKEKGKNKKNSNKAKKSVDNTKKIRIKEDIPKTTVISEEEEKKIRKRTSVISYFVIALIIFGIISSIVDYTRVKKDKVPIFAIAFFANKESTVVKYYGLGYKVIDFRRASGLGELKFGSWFMKLSDFELENLVYNKKRELNVVKLKILEDLTKITNKVEKIPKNPDKYIEKNKDQYNQIKEIESGYQYFIELILHSESATQFDKYILAKMVNEKNEKIDFKFKNAREFIEQYEVYLSKLNLEELEDTDLDKIAYSIIFGNPEIN